MESQIKAIEKTAKEIAQSLPMYAPKPLNMKKMVDREIEARTLGYSIIIVFCATFILKTISRFHW